LIILTKIQSDVNIFKLRKNLNANTTMKKGYQINALDAAKVTMRRLLWLGLFRTFCIKKQGALNLLVFFKTHFKLYSQLVTPVKSPSSINAGSSLGYMCCIRKLSSINS
jgi:hypothetical protein